MRHWVGILVLASTVAIGEEPAERLPDVGDPGAETLEVAAESLPVAPRPIEDPSDDGRHHGVPPGRSRPEHTVIANQIDASDADD